MDNEKYQFTTKMDFDIITPTKFSLLIEEMVLTKNMSYIDACLEYCKEKEIEPNSLGRLVNKALKQKIQMEAEQLHFLPKTNSLPV
ncbi:uncharacterized protein METZ01_LOCUS456198 [marine metagenome]|uniref:Uncharacterized protein n=1 Tax=marine metagenome TaxID=408172 RepID=A0A383A6S9_9ZZZZ